MMLFQQRFQMWRLRRVTSVSVPTDSDEIDSIEQVTYELLSFAGTPGHQATTGSSCPDYYIRGSSCNFENKASLTN